MTTPTENQSPRERTWIYVSACVILAAMAFWAILAFSAARETDRAEEKADELIAALHRRRSSHPRQGSDRSCPRR